jgi:hypothetical protein
MSVEKQKSDSKYPAVCGLPQKLMDILNQTSKIPDIRTLPFYLISSE